MRLIDADNYEMDILKAYDDVTIELDVLNKQHTVDAIIIPDKATNGDMIMAMFNCMVIEISKGKVYVEHIYFPFDEAWWNATYKAKH